MKNNFIYKSGFIGNNIFNELIRLGHSITNVDLRKSIDEIKKEYTNKSFDIFIHVAGVHPYRDELNEKVFLKIKRIIKKIEPIFSKSKK